MSYKSKQAAFRTEASRRCASPPSQGVFESGQPRLAIVCSAMSHEIRDTAAKNTTRPDRPAVLFAAYLASPLRGSEPGNSWSVACDLTATGWRVEMITTARFKDEWPAELPDGLRITVVSDSVPRILNRGLLGVYARYIAWQTRSIPVAKSLVADGGLDVAHHFSWGSLAVGSPLWRLGIPFVFGPVGGGSVPPKELLPLMRRRDRWREHVRRIVVRGLPVNPRARRTLANSVVIAANSDTAKLVRNRCKTEPKMMMPEATPDGLLAAVPHDVGSRDPWQVVWLGRLFPWKGITLALNALSLCDPRARLTVVGGGPELERAKGHARSLGIEDRVRFTGQLPWNEVKAELDLAKVFLFSSIRDTTGAQLLEAAARGLPIVGIAHQGVGDYVPRNAGRLVSLADASAVARGLAEGIDALLTDDEEWMRASVAARQFADINSSAHRTKRIIDAYEQALQGGAQRESVQP